MSESSALPMQYPVLSIRTYSENPNHHLWNNNGTWYLCYTIKTSPVTTDRIRTSLRTQNLENARALRDRILTKCSRREAAV